MARLRQTFQYHYKKYFAIGFIVLALACEIGSLIVSIVSMVKSPSSSSDILTFLPSIWNFVILCTCYYLILQGNIKNSMMAIQGVMSFIFMSVLLLVVDAFVDGLFNFGNLISGNNSWITILLIILMMAFMAFAIASGIVAFIKLRGYFYNRNGNIKNVIAWSITFFSCLILSWGFSIGLNLYLFPSASMVLSLLDSIGELCCAISCCFTVPRLAE